MLGAFILWLRSTRISVASNRAFATMRGALQRRRLSRLGKRISFAAGGDSESAPENSGDSVPKPSADAVGNEKEQPHFKPHELLKRDEMLPASAKVPRGLYVHGDVGTGKTLCVDMFFDSISATVPSKRIHFHEFMLDVHQRVHEAKKDVDVDALVTVADQLSEEAHVLCLDEFQVTDVADAMIMRRLFTSIFLNGTVLIATSNRPPEDLYEGGLNRFYFLPFIDTLKKFCKVHSMESTTDHRRSSAQNSDGFFFGSEHGSSYRKQIMDEAFERWSGVAASAFIPPASIPVRFGRTIQFPSVLSKWRLPRPLRYAMCRECIAPCDECCRFRGSLRRTQCVCIGQRSRIGTEKPDVARRFVTLVDILYDRGVKLAISRQTQRHPTVCSKSTRRRPKVCL